MTARRLAVVMSALALLAAPIGLRADAGDSTLVHACVSRKTGAVRIVGQPSACDLRKENPVRWNVVGPEGPMGPPGPRGLAGPAGPAGLARSQGFSGLQVVDADGELVGQLVTDMIVARRLGEDWILLGATKQHVFGTNPLAVLYYVTADCSGDIYLAENPFLLARGVLLGSTLYYASGVASELTIRSARILDYASTTPCISGDFEVRASPTGKLDLSTLTPPFRVTE